MVYNSLKAYKSWDEDVYYNTYQKAQDACLRKLIQIVNQNKDE